LTDDRSVKPNGEASAMSYQYFDGEDRDDGEAAQVRDWLNDQQRADDHAASVSDGWETYIQRSIASAIVTERDFLVEVVGEAIREALDAMWKDIEAETKRAIKMAFLERSGWAPRIRGTWAAQTEYSALDIVARDGGLYICKHGDPGSCPGEGWQLMSQRGKSGQRGETGPAGPPGRPGPQGDPGPDLVGWKIDRERFLAIPLLRGGHYGPPLELRELFEAYHCEVNGIPMTADTKTAADSRHSGKKMASPIIALALSPEPPVEEPAPAAE
jgi:hypothetical protein